MSNLLLKKSSFIHIPKCAGTLVQEIVVRLRLCTKRYERPQNGHLFLHQMKESESTYNFTFVRHPYTWWPSFWNWSKNDRFSEMEKSCEKFDEWIEDYGPFWMGHYSKLVSRYTGTDSNYQSNTKINFIGKLENLYEDLNLALKNANEDFSDEKYHKIINEIKTKVSENDPKFIKKQNIQQYDRNISDSAKKIIYNTERYMFDTFNYEP